ncbi:MAG: hypothetical protein A3I66_16105 [Burkholderiales bacterium RIFCSPLOWO2_02_FULL_57_36]|nr:MAG: hypothetical protein A3I66_16105 [Burkholderiales bacterium RIFCSPLOWO2_02_FULL_57_36]
MHAPIRARETAGSAWRHYEKLFVPGGVEHALSFNGQAVAVLFFEEQSRIYREFLIRYSLPKTCLSAPQEITKAWLADTDALQGNHPQQGDALLEKIALQLLPNLGEFRQLDPRVLRAIEIMQAQPDRNFTAQELADSVCLSASRLSVLFAANMGLPLRRYRVWLRLRSIVGLISQGMSLTEAALMAGFSDSAHFSNSCRKLLGIKPSDVLRTDGSLRILLSTRL